MTPTHLRRPVRPTGLIRRRQRARLQAEQATADTRKAKLDEARQALADARAKQTVQAAATGYRHAGRLTVPGRLFRRPGQLGHLTTPAGAPTAAPVLAWFPATKVPPWTARSHNRAANKAARASRKANRR